MSMLLSILLISLLLVALSYYAINDVLIVLLTGGTLEVIDLCLLVKLNRDWLSSSVIS